MLQRHEVFAGFERIEQFLLFLELLIGIAGGLDGQADAAFALVNLDDPGGDVLAEEVRDTPEFKILHYRHKSLLK